MQTQQVSKQQLLVQQTTRRIRFYTFAYTIIFGLMILGLFALNEIQLTPVGGYLVKSPSATIHNADSTGANKPLAQPVNRVQTHGHRHQPIHGGAQASGVTHTIISSTSSQKTYIVVQGDTLDAIATRNHTTWTYLASYNHLTNPDLILVGQHISLPPM